VKSIVLTTSWDDGHRSDLRLARLLGKYGLKGTFYISPHNQEFAQSDLLTEQEIRDIGRDFEIGAHTLTHRPLPSISEEEAEKEIAGSKSLLEQITGRAVDAFCYPRGAYRESDVRLVAAAGYRYARTVKRYAFEVKNPYRAPTSLHIYNHRSTFELVRTTRFSRFRPIVAWRCLQWDVLGRSMFDRLLSEGGIFHIWGHSWEIDQADDWQPLEDLFRYISGHPTVTYTPNGELKANA
jgi:peptidoglycan-N-acetylglucosamine deacetylase